MLRHPKVVSEIEAFTSGCFQEVICEEPKDPKKIKRLVFCSGKVYYDLLEYKEELKDDKVALVRVEQLYPMPERALDEQFKKYPKAERVWLQEEPKNGGAWTYWLRREEHKGFRLISRKASSSPATGYSSVHKQQQKEIVEEAFKF